MINIIRKEDCCGCSVCYDACPRNAIEMIADKEGFLYPKININNCINCGLCNKVCPIENSDTLNKRNDNFTPIVLGAYHQNDNIRISSTSGGAFWAISEDFVKNGGYVVGAIFTEKFEIKHFITNNIKELEKIKGSKYAQSDCRGIYKKIKELLQKGEKVLATGLPCQMAGLRQYLRKEYENLIVVDLICHSVTSPLAFSKYIEFLENKYKSRITKYHPKNKEYGGWHNFAFIADFENGKRYIKIGVKDYFTRIFVGSQNLFSRYSCYECHYKHFPQPSDITIGDFWGIEKIDKEFDSPKGISKIIINNEKGKKYIESLNNITIKEYDTNIAVFDNPRSASMIKPVSRCNEIKRKEFVQDLLNCDFEYCMIKHFMPEVSIKQKIKKKIKLLCLHFK